MGGAASSAPAARVLRGSCWDAAACPRRWGWAGARAAGACPRRARTTRCEDVTPGEPPRDPLPRGPAAQCRACRRSCRRTHRVGARRTSRSCFAAHGSLQPRSRQLGSADAALCEGGKGCFDRVLSPAAMEATPPVCMHTSGEAVARARKSMRLITSPCLQACPGHGCASRSTARHRHVAAAAACPRRVLWWRAPCAAPGRMTPRAKPRTPGGRAPLN